MGVLSRLLAAGAFVLAFAIPLAPGAALAQIDAAVRDRVLPAAVQVGLLLDVTGDGVSFREYLPVGSGTIVSPDGLILTNWHVVDMVAHQAELAAWEAQSSQDGVSLSLDLDATQLVILTTGASDLPEPTYLAQVVAEHHALDFAVLQITADAVGHPIEPGSLELAYVPLGDSSSVRQGDAIHLFGYPATGGGTLQYTAGVVSGFNFEEGLDGRAWITTDATMAGGSSGGTAIDGAGRLIGVPTQGTALDCRPGDTNFDGTVDAEDVGCIPVGGSIGQLRPINLARDILAQAGLDLVLTTVGGQDQSEGADSDDEAPERAAELLREEPETPSGGTWNDPTIVTDEEGRDQSPPTQGVPVWMAASTLPQYVADCAAIPNPSPGTRIVLPDDAQVWRGAPDLLYDNRFVSLVPAGTIVEVTGPSVEKGECDWWPIRFERPPLWGTQAEEESTGGAPPPSPMVDAFIWEWFLSQAQDAAPPTAETAPPPLPPPITQGYRTGGEVIETDGVPFSDRPMESCVTGPVYPVGTILVVSPRTFLSGPGSTPDTEIPKGTKVRIIGSYFEDGLCDLWPVEVVEGPEPGRQGWLDERVLELE